MRKVRPGDPLRITAKAWNEFIDAAEFVKSLRHRLGNTGGRVLTDQDVVLVKNASGSDLARFGVLEITGVVFSPTDDADGFKSGPVLSGVAPTADMVGNFVVAMEPIADGELGRAVVGGLAVAYLNVIDAAHEYADTASGVTATLRTCPAGSAQILWKEAGTGSKWAVVRLGATPGQKIADATGIQLQAEGCYNITDDDLRYPGGQDVDWRGRLLRVTIAYLDDDETDADDSDAWSTVTITPFRCGIDANGGNVGGRGNSISIHTLTAGGGNVYPLLDGVSGYAAVMSIGIRDPEHLQYHVRIDAGGQYDEDTNDDIDGGV